MCKNHLGINTPVKDILRTLNKSQAICMREEDTLNLELLIVELKKYGDVKFVDVVRNLASRKNIEECSD